MANKWSICGLYPSKIFAKYRNFINHSPIQIEQSFTTAEPSKILNKMLQHMGNNMFDIMLKLVNMCLIIGDIPAEWRDTLLYPIPKTIDWENDLTKTHPITLLESMQKAFIKIITKKLSYIMYDKQILKGGNQGS
jgi:hypothetical protein